MNITMKKCCVLCRSREVKMVNEISVSELKKVYRVSGFDIERDVGEFDKINLYRCNECDIMYFDPANPGSQEFYEQFQEYLYLLL